MISLCLPAYQGQRRIERLCRAADLARFLRAGPLAFCGQKRSPYIDPLHILLTGGQRMRILIAGATGAIGRPLIRCLKQDAHTVFGLAYSPESSHVVAQLGAEPVAADALDAASVK